MIVTSRRPAPGRDRPALAAPGRWRGRGRGDEARARRPGRERCRVDRGARRRGALRRQDGRRRSRPHGARWRSSATASRSVGPVVAGRTGTIVSLVAADGSRTMASDRGVSPELSADALDRELVRLTPCTCRSTRSCESRSPQPLFARPSSPSSSPSTSLRGVRSATSGRSGSASGSRRSIPDVVFANEAEEEAIGGRVGSSTWIVKLGERGARFGLDEELSRSTRHGSSTRPAPATPSRPAGSSAAPSSPLAAAARCVAQLGSMP